MKHYILSFLLLFIFSCSSKHSQTSKTNKSSFLKRSSNFEQVIEGRIQYITKVLVLGGKNITKNNYEASVSGIRTYKKNNITDVFEQIKKINKKSSEILHPSGFVKFNFINNPGTIKIGNIDNTRFQTQLKSLYRLVHTLPEAPSQNMWSLSDTQDATVLGVTIQIKRKFNFKIDSSKTEKGTVLIKGKYIAETLKPILVRGFKIEILGKGESEAEFNTETGTWTHVKANLIQGWLGSTIQNNQEMIVGYQIISNIDFYFSKKNNTAYQQ